MKILITGVNGQLGHDILHELISRDDKGLGEFTCIGTDIGAEYLAAREDTPTPFEYLSLDITDEAKVDLTIRNLQPDAVIHCAAWTAVDLAEEEENKEKVSLINSLGSKYIVNAVKKLDDSQAHGCKMIYISTDYVFNGMGEEAWEADCKDYAPINHYGKTKLDGELIVSETLSKYFIVRIAWVFGKNGKNFIKTMLNIAKTRKELKVVHDQIGTPTYTYDLAKLLCDMVVTEKYGYYHATNSEVKASSLEEEKEGYTKDGCKIGYISWYDFTKEIFRQAVELGYTEYQEEQVHVSPVTTAEYGLSKALRPLNSRLDKSKLIENGFTALPTWQDAVNRYLKEIEF